ncbi:MAG: hypothetical protein J6R04_04915 [Clostridia bacterium]|nr:hypothetical protein [Clostridia bacterium]
MNDHFSHTTFQPLINFDFTDITPSTEWQEDPEWMECDKKAMEALTSAPLPCKLSHKGILILSTMALSCITLAYLNGGTVELYWEPEMEYFYAVVIVDLLPMSGNCAEIMHNLSKISEVDVIARDERLVILPTVALQHLVEEST